MDNHTQSWSDADVRKYREGKLSAREMHELEKAALDDPFLADALEGFAGAAPANDRYDIEELRTRLAARVAKKEHALSALSLRKPAFRIAAAFILLTGLGLTFYYTLFRSSTRPSPATAHNRARPADSTVTTQTLASGKAADTIATTTVALNRRRPAQHTHHSASPPPSVTETVDDASLAISPAPSRLDKELAAPVRGLMITPSTKQAPLVFSGRVVDASNRPLQGASFLLNGNSNIGVTSDSQGNFNFALRARDTAQQMTVAVPGYEQASFALNTIALTNNVIQLQEAKPSLDEVVVTGYGAKRKETRAFAPSDSNDRLDSGWIKVFPVIGRPAYRQYLDSAKTALKLDTSIHGTVRISFLVDQKGQLTEFKIEQSLSPAHDAGLIQLISGGPAWRLLHGKKTRAAVSLSFP